MRDIESTEPGAGESDFLVPRRRWLMGAGALASAAAMPWWLRGAAAQPASALNLLPRVGLVIGNTRYADAPLKNPANDARAIGTELQKFGFQITVKLDAGKSEMLDAIRAFGAELGKRKAVGFFYYAGHGIQLAWRNYLIPVDAAIGNLDDVRPHAVELNVLLEGIAMAKNPMNVVVLDACRDNPFGNKVLAPQKGLSQFDAPPGSLLAYATAPGNTADDGEGANGLYTENLLREMKVPQSRIEDVFKRVRLNVRRKSDGRQIPWESTSLEEDFYFQPPRETKTVSEADATKRFEEELAIWERIKAVNEPVALEDYLRRYPSGLFSELAQLRLDQVLAQKGEKKIEVVSNEQNPFSRGTTRADTQLKVGDRYSYREVDVFTLQETRKYTLVVTEITDTEVIYNKGSFVTDLIGNPIKLANGTRYVNAQHMVPEYSLGKRWTARHRLTLANGGTYDSQVNYKVVAMENVTVPAGVFNAFRVEGDGWSQGDKGTFRVQNTYWIATGVRRVIGFETRQTHTSGKVVKYERVELTAYVQK
jgi:uncharacterized caspase-like protein